VPKLRPIARARLLIAVAVSVLALAVWGVTSTQRSAAETTFQQGESALQMLTAMVDQETGMRGFALTGEERFLEPYRSGRREYASALARARAATRGEPQLRRLPDTGMHGALVAAEKARHEIELLEA
jgi:methyl-accepting chemotaxis protein